MSFSSELLQSSKWFRHARSVICLSGALLLSQASQATTVLFETSVGNFEVNLFDKTTPKTVANFLSYVKANAYRNTVVHRSIPGFVVQGGGFSYQGKLPLTTIAQNAVVENEPVYSNLRGTIAMAKGSAVNSATNQWFINLNDKNATDKEHGFLLDNNTGGFTVFGQVTNSGMEIVDQIAAINRFNMGTGTAFQDFPLRNYSSADATANKPITGDNLMIIHNITVLNADPDTAANLNPTKNTLVKEKDSSGGGGSSSLMFLSLLGFIIVVRKAFKIQSAH